MGNRGILLRPGETLFYQASPQWRADAHGLYSTAKVVVEPDSGEKIRMRRIRFPQVDTGHAVQAGEKITVPEGCNGISCTLIPATVPPGFPQVNSNWWHTVDRKTMIRGASFFLSSGHLPGTQKFSGCIVSRDRNGKNKRKHYCFSASDQRIGPETYGQLRYGKKGSAFVRINKEIPAGSSIGVNFSLESDTPGTLDFALYLWVQDNNP